MFYPSSLDKCAFIMVCLPCSNFRVGFSRISLRNVIVGGRWPVTPLSCRLPLHPESWLLSHTHMWTSLHSPSPFTPLKTAILWFKERWNGRKDPYGFWKQHGAIWESQGIRYLENRQEQGWWTCVSRRLGWVLFLRGPFPGCLVRLGWTGITAIV